MKKIKIISLYYYIRYLNNIILDPASRAWLLQQQEYTYVLFLFHRFFVYTLRVTIAKSGQIISSKMLTINDRHGAYAMIIAIGEGYRWYTRKILPVDFIRRLQWSFEIITTFARGPPGPDLYKHNILYADSNKVLL